MGHIPQCSWGQHTREALWCSGAVAVSLCRTLSYFTQQQFWPKLSHCDHKCQGRMTTSCLSKYPTAICRRTKSRNPMNNLSVLINNYTREYVDSYQKPQTDRLSITPDVNGVPQDRHSEGAHWHHLVTCELYPGKPPQQKHSVHPWTLVKAWFLLCDLPRLACKNCCHQICMPLTTLCLCPGLQNLNDPLQKNLLASLPASLMP